MYAVIHFEMENETCGKCRFLETVMFFDETTHYYCSLFKKNLEGIQRNKVCLDEFGTGTTEKNEVV